MNNAEILRQVQNGTLTPQEAARYLLEGLRKSQDQPSQESNSPVQIDLTGLMYRPVWHLSPTSPKPPPVVTRTLICADDRAIHETPVRQLVTGVRTLLGEQALVLPIAEYSQADFDALLEGETDGIHLLWLYHSPYRDLLSLDAVQAMETRSLYPLLRLIRALHARWGTGATAHLKLVTFNTHRLLDSESTAAGQADPTGAALAGVVKVLRREYPKWQVSNLDLDA